MKIGIDLDEVIADFMNALLSFYYKKTGKLYKKEDFPEWNLWPLLGKTKEEAVKFVDEFHESHSLEEVKPMGNAIESIKRLIKNNHEIFIITSRPKRFKQKAEEWLLYYIKSKIKVINAGDFHKGQAVSKAEICKELDIPILLEDAPDTALECTNSGIFVILFDKPWNKKIKHKNIRRVFNWTEAIKEIEKFMKINN